MKSWIGCLLLASSVLMIGSVVHQTISGGQVYLSGTSGSMGGSLLSVASCETTTATVNGAAVGQPVEWAVVDGSDRIGLGLNVHADVTSSNTVTVKECAIVAVTPASKSFNVRVFP